MKKATRPLKDHTPQLSNKSILKWLKSEKKTTKKYKENFVMRNGKYFVLSLPNPRPQLYK